MCIYSFTRLWSYTFQHKCAVSFIQKFILNFSVSDHALFSLVEQEGLGIFDR